MVGHSRFHPHGRVCGYTVFEFYDSVAPGAPRPRSYSQDGLTLDRCPSRWGVRYCDVHGAGRRKSAFPSKSAALARYREVIEAQLRGDPMPLPELTLAEFVPVYLKRHAASVRSRTITTLSERLAHAVKTFGSAPLRDLERISGELASCQAKLPARSRYGIVQALRQALEAAVRWGHLTTGGVIL